MVYPVVAPLESWSSPTTWTTYVTDDIQNVLVVSDDVDDLCRGQHPERPGRLRRRGRPTSRDDIQNVLVVSDDVDDLRHG